MDHIITKSVILERLQHEYECFHTCLVHLTPEQLDVAGTIRDWSVKDLIAHLIAHEQRALNELRLAIRGERLLIDHDAGDTFNAGAVAARRPYPIEAVFQTWQRSFEEVVAEVMALSDEYFDASHPITTVLDDTIDGALSNNTYAHYREHIPDVELAIQHFRA